LILFIARWPSRRGGVEFARGLGSEQVREAIGASAYDEVVHRNNLVVLKQDQRPA
jgi:hypothetical protein